MTRSELSRRHVLGLFGGAGLSFLLPGRWAHAAAPGALAQGPFWLFVHAGGGWDPTMLCDPKGRASEASPDPVNHYLSSQIGQAGALRFAPVGGNQAFFEKHRSRTLVINGLDTETNSHDVGTRNTWSGKLAEGYPALAALVAQSGGIKSPLAFVSFGGYDETQGVVAPSRLGNTDVFARIAYPLRMEDKADSPTFHTTATWNRILAAQERRRQTLLAQDLVPKARASVERLFQARFGNDEITRLVEALPKEKANDGLPRQAQLAMAAFKAGVAKTASLSIGGFDTHGDHDNRQGAALGALLAGVDFAWDEAERQGVAGELVVVVGSDFGRTPRYNDGQGKDHWSITSMLLMGKGIPGDRVIGATNERQEAMNVDPQTLAVVDSGGVRLRPAHVHRALRKLAGLETDPVASQRFPITSSNDLQTALF